MALVPCAQCRQPFYASCHDCSCLDVTCPYCEYAYEVLVDAVPCATESHDGPAFVVQGSTLASTAAVLEQCGSTTTQQYALADHA